MGFSLIRNRNVVIDIIGEIGDRRHCAAAWRQLALGGLGRPAMRRRAGAARG